MHRHEDGGPTLADGSVSSIASAIPREVRTFLQPLAALVSEFVVGELRAKGGSEAAARYYTSRTSPLPRKAFLAAARANRFPSFVVHRRVLALCDDVHRYIEASRRHRRPETVARGDDDEIGRLLDGANLKPKRRR